MKNILGRKQSMKNDDWINALEHIEELVTLLELEKLAEQTIEDIRRHTAGKNVAYAWSAGKDSLVLGNICRRAGIEKCMLAVCDLEYPSFVDWIDANRPDGLEIINTNQNMEWLKKHPEMLFPQESKTTARWFSIVQHRAQEKYYKTHNLDMILLGRRRADGNYCGKGSNIYTDGKGVTRYSPLAGWKHEAILAYIHYYKLPMPPIYGWPNGYLCGTHPWPARRRTGSELNGWAEIHQINPKIVREAAGVFPEAREYLKSIKE